jgi:hypothetical protein
MRWFRNKSFVVRMVDTNDVDQTEETVVIDVDKTVDKTVQAVLIIIGGYMVLSTARQLIVGHPNPAQITNTIAPVISPVFSNTVNNVGPVCKFVKRLEDEKIWEKSIDAARQLAEEQGITLERAKWLISRNANGHIPDVFNMHYENIGLHTAG